MHVRTHQAVALKVYDALPREAQEFLRLSDVELRWYARVPDEIAGDNIAVFGGCSEVEAHSHSWKMQRNPDGTFTHLTGSAPTTIAEVPRLARNAVRAGRFDEAREHMATLMHYTVDVTTIWHLTRELTSANHRSGEADVAKRVDKLLAHPGPLKLPEPKSLYRSVIAVAEETASSQLDRVKQAQADGGHLPDDLAAEMVQRCADFTLACVLYVWPFIARA